MKSLECIAKYVRRPLLRLTVADIGTDEREMEDILGQWFRRCAHWGAIILIDEADVFLEKRQVKDLQRNSLVSGELDFSPLKQATDGCSVPKLYGVLYRNVIFSKLRFFPMYFEVDGI